jgi:hypothetical protein
MLNKSNMGYPVWVSHVFLLNFILFAKSCATWLYKSYYIGRGRKNKNFFSGSGSNGKMNPRMK